MRRKRGLLPGRCHDRVAGALTPPMPSRLRRYAIPFAAIALYLLIALCFATRGVGLEEDEAISFRRAVLTAEGVHTPCQQGYDIKFRNVCLPLMIAPYVGAAKDYLFLPLFVIAGFHVTIARMSAALLASVGIFGVWFLAEAAVGTLPAAFAAGFLALNPTYLDLPLFDQGNVALSVCLIGLIFIALARSAQSPSHGRFVLLGMCLGIGIWGRLNFAWLVGSGAVAIVAVYRRDLLRFSRYAPALASGVLMGMTPLLKFLVHHARDLTQFISATAVPLTFAQKLRGFPMLLADVFTAAKEHRAGIWHAGGIPPPISFGVATLILIAFAYCATKRNRPAFALALTVAILSLTFLNSALPVGAHHLIVLLPLSAIPIGVALQGLWRSRIAGRALCGFIAISYAALGSAIDLQTVRDLNRTGGYGEWSASVAQLTSILEKNDGVGALYLLDWGFKDPLLLLSHGRLQGVELFWNCSARFAQDGVTWAHLVYSGGRFVTYSAANLHFAEGTIQFERALQQSRKSYRKLELTERDASPYASVYLIPRSTGPEPVAPSGSEGPLTSFFASPDHIVTSNPNRLGKTALYFWTSQSPLVEIHVNAPGGSMLARFRSAQQTTSGVAVTENWVKDGTTFFLQDVAGKPLTAEHTLATVKVSVQSSR